MKKNNNFDYLNMYLGKSNLIESSAGTGKTNIISLLYLRFLLKINIDKFFNSLYINNILVVTFTDLAILEIKNRILNNIKNLRISCLKNKLIDEKISNIYFYIKNKPNIIDLLIQYENFIDKSSIYTIHGFCKKIIFSYFIISKINYSYIIINNEFELIYDIVKNYWRKYFYNLNNEIINIILSYWSNPNILFKCIYNIYNIMNLNIKKNNKYFSIESCYYNIINFIIKFKKEWILNYKNFYNFLYKNKYFKYLRFKVNYKILFNEIKFWCNIKTKNFFIPNFLYKFSYNYLIKINNNKELINYYITIYIDKLLSKIKNLYNYILIDCFEYVKKNIFLKKKKKSYLSFNDLVINLNEIIINDKNNVLLNLIRNNFPIILIDEFQDTDSIQYNIFNKIYIKNRKKNTKIILIGDPKQCIYSFRGANILNYIKIKKNVDFLYNFNINWRSSVNFVKSLNYLFNRINNPFIYRNIKYISVIPSYKNKFLFLYKNNVKLNSMNFFIINNLNNINYKEKIIEFCAIKISKILFSNKNEYFISNKKNIKRKIIESDIALLVYKNSDIKIILKVFKKFNLKTNCILDKSNIFKTLEAKEVMFVLKAILFPQSINNICNCLSTYMFNFDFFQINKFINNKLFFSKLIKKFILYHNIWENYGIYSLFYYIYKKKKNYNIDLNKYNRYKINLFHIIEILNKEYYKLNDKYLLLKWLNDSIINTKDICNNEYFIRSYFSIKKKGINVSTIHKSKGLQFNIVWIPFLINLNNNNYIYNKNINFLNIKINLFNKKNNNILFLKDFLSEEMRLLYVAITRSIYQCNIILYNLKNKFFKTPISRLIFYDNNVNINKIDINNIYKKFNLKYINVKIINLFIFLKNNINKKFFFIYKKKKKNKSNFLKKIDFSYLKKVISYSKIIYLNKSIFFDLIDKYDYKNILLPKGKKIGKFFHKVLEKIDFLSVDNNLILNYINKFNINKNLFFVIKRILLNILNVILLPLNINLRNKNIVYFWKEFEFCLNIKKFICFNKYNKIIKKYDKISKLCSNILIKNKIIGFLNGFIDLIFLYNNKYYIIDFKSNLLGNDYNDYNKKELYKVICNYRYDIQYQIYSIALNKYLNLNFKMYNYKHNFGGIYYIFLRGLLLYNNNISYTGLLYIKPNFKLINKLNYFFE